MTNRSPGFLLSPKQFSLFFWIVSSAAFLIVALRCLLVPFNHDETATFYFFIQSDSYMPFHTDADANNHVLNSFLGNICFHLFGSSPFALRLPNLLSFGLLIFSTYKISRELKSTTAKVFLTVGLILCFNWISFFNACRGYGLSLALFTYALACLLDFLKSQSLRSFLLTLLFFQLAISSNLIFVIIVLLLSGIMILNQATNKKLLRFSVILAWLIHFGLIFYWMKYSFFLKEHGALYYGAGDSYWEVTFVTLFQVITGSWSEWLDYIIVLLFIAVIVLAIYVNREKLHLKSQLLQPALSLLFAFVLVSLVAGFYFMHVFMGVNYPEDRTGLFFYLFFVLLLAFTLDEIPLQINVAISYALSLIIVIHFFINLNFRKHQLYVYETIPPHFYDTLVKEQEKSTEHITIGGHRVRELFYDFLNYRHGGILNPVTFSGTMHMNTDYCLGTTAEDKYYKKYYEVIDTEPDWGFVVLKRKKKIEKTILAEVKDKTIETNDGEFIEVYRSSDTIMRRPLQAEFNFTIENMPVPANTWMVLQVNDSAGQTHTYKRYPLQWSGYDLNGKTFTYDLTTENLPLKIKNIVCYFWNIKKEPFRIRLHSLKLMELGGEGIEYEAPDVR
jgi:hypothetical protein